jgi:hypothetical protein
MNRPTDGVGGSLRPPVGHIWLKEGKWYEQTVAGVWELPTLDIEGCLFGVRVVCGELDLPLLAGDTDAARLRAHRSEIKRACRPEIGELLGLDEIEIERICEGWL